jgi:long-chain acyl-CoA synthetase
MVRCRAAFLRPGPTREDELAKTTGKAPAAKAAAAKATASKSKAAAAAGGSEAPARKAAASKAAAAVKPAAPAKATSAKPAAKPAAAAAKAPPKAAASVKPAAAAKPKEAPAKVAAAAPKAASAAKASAKSAVKANATSAAKPGAKPARTSAPDPVPAAAVEAPKAAAKAAAGKAWHGSYPPGIATEIGEIADKSIGDLLVASCRKFADRTAFTSMGKGLTFAELEEKSRALAGYLQSRGLKKGARVALMMPNVLQYPVALMAVLRAGFTVVNVNPLYTPRELEHQLKDSGAEAIVILENFAATLQQVVARTQVKTVVVAAMGDMLGIKGMVVNLVVRRVRKMVPAWSLPGHVKFNDALKQGASKTFRPGDVGHDDVAFLQYTGGTTGVAKGAMLTHRNVLANVAQNAIWVEGAFIGRKKPERLTYVCALPLYHIYALTVNAIMGMQQGANNLLIANPRDIPGFVAELKKYEVHIFPGLNTLFNALLNNADFQKLDFKNLFLTFGGGMAVQSGVAERWKKLTGNVIAEGYGLSETSPVATANRFDGKEFTGTIGLPMPSTEIEIRDDDGKAVKQGDVGEICIRGPQVMAGYWNRPDETAKVMTPDGFFKSGDMGFMDKAGYVKIVDRKKDMILVSGFNVYPNEIEDVISQNPKVLEVAAIGVPDEKSGEVPKVFIVRKDPTLTAEEVIEFTKDKLTAYKRPKHVEFRTELPKTNVGKILRRELR